MEIGKRFLIEIQSLHCYKTNLFLMPRPKTKEELLSASTAAYCQLCSMLDSMPANELEQEFPFEHRDRNVRDVVGHLCEWQLMMIQWYDTGMSGKQPEMPAAGFTWRMTPELNRTIQQKHQASSLQSLLSQLSQTHEQLMATISSHTQNELFTRQHYAWTGSTSLASYLTSALPSHYEWAIRLLRKYRRALKQVGAIHRPKDD